jgi:hypothetical protein
MTREIERLNDRLGSDLGRNPFGEPVYRWGYSESMFHDMIVAGEFDMVDTPSGLVVCEPAVERRKLCPTLDHQWVIVKWCDAGSEEAWRAQFGSRLLWPRRGYVVPTNMCLAPGEVPDFTVTVEVIGKVRAERQKSYFDYVNESQSEMERTERKDHERLVDMIANECTAFGNIKPGSRSGGVSFPSAQSA